MKIDVMIIPTRRFMEALHSIIECCEFSFNVPTRPKITTYY